MDKKEPKKMPLSEKIALDNHKHPNRKNKRIAQTLQNHVWKFKYLYLFGLISFFIVLYAVTASAPSQWLSTTSNNCPWQDVGGRMTTAITEAEGEVTYVIGKEGVGTRLFKKYNPLGVNGGTGDCEVTDLDEPNNVDHYTDLEPVDVDNDGFDEYIYTANYSNLDLYSIEFDEWIGENIRPLYRQSDKTLVPAKQFETGPYLEPDASAEYNGKLYFSGNNRNGLYSYIEYDPTTNTFDQANATINLSILNGRAVNDLIFTVNANNRFNVYDITNDEWRTLPPFNYENFFDSTSAIAAGIDGIYILPGNGTKNFYKYQITNLTTGEGTWTQLANAPGNIQDPEMHFPNPTTDNYIYVSPGTENDMFWRYNVTTDTWETGLPDMPADMQVSIMTSDPTYIYVGFGNSKSFYRYHLTNQTWEELPKAPFEFPANSESEPVYIANGTDGKAEIYFFTYGYYSPPSKFVIDDMEWPMLIPAQVPDQGFITNEATRKALVQPGPSTEDPTGNILYLLNGENYAEFHKFYIDLNEFIPWPRSLSGGPGSKPIAQFEEIDASTTRKSNTLIKQNNKLINIGYGIEYDSILNQWQNSNVGTIPNSTLPYFATAMHNDADLYYLRAANDQDGSFYKYDFDQNITLWEDDDPYGLALNGDYMYANGNLFNPHVMEMVGDTLYLSDGIHLLTYDTQTNKYSKSIIDYDGRFYNDATIVGNKIFGFTVGDDYHGIVVTDLDTLKGGIPNPDIVYNHTQTGAQDTGYDDGELIYYPGSGNDIYLTIGNNTSEFVSYTITDSTTGEGTYTQLADIPENLYAGAGLTSLGSNLY
ncbi:hypothetical protein GF340_00685, partial [Candidatus Peregrinibacteria bacterium]|nr:hypothetical protein [Candidatus Peregrinibacteria bacterium]